MNRAAMQLGWLPVLSVQGLGSLHPFAGWPECHGSGVIARDPEVSSSLRHQHADLVRLSA